MTLGELVDLLEEHERRKQDVQQARQSLEHGGSPTTMLAKQETLEMFEASLEELRHTSLGGVL